MDGQLKQDIADCIQKVLTVFTTQYVKAYMLSMVHMIEDETNEEPKEWELLERPKDEKADQKSGWLAKESIYLKKWDKRFFIIRPDYQADYYESESHVAKGKLRGTLNLSGYSVIEDPNQGALIRLKRLAEKMGVDFSNLPKPKEYPPLTLELHHDRRICNYLQATSQEEFDGWVKMFRHACWNATGLSWDDELHKDAFPIALRKTRWELSRWGWWNNAGSEEQMLAEMISDELEYDIMGRLYANLPGAAPWFIRNKLRKMAMSTVDSMVLVAVKPGWATMRKAVETARPKAEPKVRESTKPLFEAKNGVKEKMQSSVMGVIEPLLAQHVTPHLGKIARIIKTPITEAFDEAMRLFEAKVDKWEPKPDAKDPKENFGELDSLGYSWWEMRSALNKVDAIYEPLYSLREVFSDIWPWHYVWEGHNLLYEKTDNAVYTFEQGIAKGEKDVVKRDVMLKFRHDADLAIQQYCISIMRQVVMPPFQAVLNPACKNIIEPMADLVPGPLQEFCDLNEMFEDIYNGVVDDSIKVVLRNENSE